MRRQNAVVARVAPCTARTQLAVGVRRRGRHPRGTIVIFDPLPVGPKAFGGPRRLQVWRRVNGSHFSRVAEGEGPFFSEFLGAHLVTIEEGRRLRIAENADGSDLWPTGEELERAREERALARVAELEAALGRRGL